MMNRNRNRPALPGGPLLALAAALALSGGLSWALPFQPGPLPDLSARSSVQTVAVATPPAEIALGETPANPTTAQKAALENRRKAFERKLGLTADQSAKIKAVVTQGKTQSRALHAQLKSKHGALIKYLQSPQANEPQALSMNAEINALQKQVSELRVKTWFAMRAQLTPEQLQKLSQLHPPGMGGQGGCMGAAVKSCAPGGKPAALPPEGGPPPF